MRREKLLCLPEIEPRFLDHPAHGLVTTLTELPLLSIPVLYEQMSVVLLLPVDSCLINLTILISGDEYEFCSLSLCNFLHYPAFSSQ
jgi:hypothetical protein